MRQIRSTEAMLIEYTGLMRWATLADGLDARLVLWRGQNKHSVASCSASRNYLQAVVHTMIVSGGTNAARVDERFLLSVWFSTVDQVDSILISETHHPPKVYLFATDWYNSCMICSLSFGLHSA